MSLLTRAKASFAKDGPLGKPVLIVEDDAGVRAYLAAVLQNQGFRVLVAENAEQALKLLEHEPAQLAVLDIGLPGQMDVFALAEQLADDVAVIMVTGDPLSAMGHDGYRILHKPLVPEALEQAVEQAVGLQPA